MSESCMEREQPNPEVGFTPARFRSEGQDRRNLVSPAELPPVQRQSRPDVSIEVFEALFHSQYVTPAG